MLLPKISLHVWPGLHGVDVCVCPALYNTASLLSGLAAACAALLLQAELQKDVERAKKLAEAEGRIKENRENEDVNRRAAMLK